MKQRYASNLIILAAFSASCSGREPPEEDCADTRDDSDMSIDLDADHEVDASTRCELGEVFYEKTHDEGASSVDVDFTNTTSIEDVLAPVFSQPLIESGRLEFTSGGLGAWSDSDGLSAKIENQWYAAFITGTSMESTFMVPTSPEPNSEKSIRLELIGGGNDGQISLVSSGIDWNGSEASIIIESFAGIDPPTSTSVVIPFEYYGETVSLRAYTSADDIAVLDLVHDGDIVATVTHDDSLISVFAMLLHVSSANPSSAPAFTLHGLRSNDVFLNIPELWRLKAPTLTFEGKKYESQPKYGAALFLDGRIYSTRAFNDPDSWPARFPFAGSTEPLRYYLVDITEEDGTSAHATFYAPAELDTVQGWLDAIFAAPARAVVKTHGVAFEYDGDAHVPTFLPEICP